MTRLLLLAGAAAVLAACSPAKPPAQGSAAPASPPPPPAATQPAPVPYAGGPLTVREDGVGPLTVSTPFDLAAVQTLFPGHKVEAAFLSTGAGVQLPILTVTQADGLQVLEIDQGAPGVIGAVRVVGGQAVAATGETLLKPWPSGFAAADCRMGQGRDRWALVCHRPGQGKLSYIFGVRGWAQDTVPPDAVLTAKAFIREFVWAPDAASAPK